MKTGSLHMDTRRKLLSKSSIGFVSRCECCEAYHLSLGNLTVRVSHADILILTWMLVEALETNMKGEHLVPENKYS